MRQFELSISEEDLDLIMTGLSKFANLIKDMIKISNNKEKTDWLNAKHEHITDLLDELRSVKFVDN